MAGSAHPMRALRALVLTTLLLAPATAGARSDEGDLPVPLAGQNGDVANCGPTAAAMVLAAYRGLDDGASVGALRDVVGRWSWDEFPMRRWSLPGRDPGMTTPQMFRATLEHFGDDLRFERIAHPFLPQEAWAMVRLRWALDHDRPVVVLVETPPLWGTSEPSLHWVVVRGVDGGRLVYNDPADGKRWTVPVDRFFDAWDLNPLFRALPGLAPFTGFVADRPLPGGRSVFASR
ncbi:MAG: C39 family peptidase [Myxococcota bacterium]